MEARVVKMAKERKRKTEEGGEKKPQNPSGLTIPKRCRAKTNAFFGWEEGTMKTHLDMVSGVYAYIKQNKLQTNPEPVNPDVKQDLRNIYPNQALRDLLNLPADIVTLKFTDVQKYIGQLFEPKVVAQPLEAVVAAQPLEAVICEEKKVEEQPPPPAVKKVKKAKKVAAEVKQ